MDEMNFKPGDKVAWDDAQEFCVIVTQVRTKPDGSVLLSGRYEDGYKTSMPASEVVYYSSILTRLNKFLHKTPNARIHKTF